ncbi:MAG TPA: hypothetical protein DC049_19440, partial [Spirochaetia bacterium]|nr:hypothetical protein [Spirochaetia bacterium]
HIYRKLQLKDLALHMNMSKSAVSNILKTIKDLGYLEKDDQGYYFLSGKFYHFLQAENRYNRVKEIINSEITNLAQTIKENVIAAVFNGYERHTIVQAVYENELTVNTNIQQNAGFYHLASTRLLLAYENNDFLEVIIKKYGFPGSDWNNINRLDELKNSLAQIKHEGITVQKENRVASFSVPFFDMLSPKTYAIGVYLPEERFQSKKKALVNEAKNTAEKLTLEIKKINTI